MNVIYLKDDAIVVSINIVGFNVNKIFIDARSSVDILFKKTLDQLRIQQLEFELFDTPFCTVKKN